MVDYSKRLTEVDEVLNYLFYEDLQKIPEEIRTLIKENKDKNYIWKYDETKSLKDQGLCRDTIVFLSYLNMEYLLDEDQKKLMEEIHNFNEQKIEKEKCEKFNSKNLFSNNKSQQNESSEYSQIVVVKENFFAKILNKLKKFFFLINNSIFFNSIFLIPYILTKLPKFDF